MKLKLLLFSIFLTQITQQINSLDYLKSVNLKEVAKEYISTIKGKILSKKNSLLPFSAGLMVYYGYTTPKMSKITSHSVDSKKIEENENKAIFEGLCYAGATAVCVRTLLYIINNYYFKKT